MSFSLSSRSAWAVPSVLATVLVSLLMWTGFAFSSQWHNFFVYCQSIILFQLNYNPMLMLLTGVMGTLLVVGIVRAALFAQGEVRRVRQIVRYLTMLRQDSTDEAWIVRAPEPMAFTIGWWHPRMIMTTALIDTLTPIEQQVILAHEQTHRVRRDPLRRLIGKMAVEVFFFLPMARELFQSVVHNQEHRADRTAVAHFGQQPLLQGMRKLLRYALRQPLATSACGAVSTSERLSRLTGSATAYSFEFSIRSLTTSLAVIALVVGSLVWTGQVQAYSPAPQVCQTAWASVFTTSSAGPMVALTEFQTVNVDTQTFIVVQSLK